jgi:hypothetical protein
VAKDREKFAKVLALAINPGAIEGEAVAALLRLRELVKQSPTLAHLPLPPPPPDPQPSLPSTTLNVRVTTVHPDWLLILVSLISQSAHFFALRYRIDFDFNEIPTALTLVCEGTNTACTSMSNQVTWCVNYINSQITNSKT